MTRRMEKTGLAALVVALVSCQLTKKAVEEVPTPSSEYPLCDIDELEAYEQEVNLYVRPSCELTNSPETWVETLGQNVDPAKIDCGLCVENNNLRDYCCYDKESTIDDFLQKETGCFRLEVRQLDNIPNELLDECFTPSPPRENLMICNYHPKDCSQLELSDPSQTCEYTWDITSEVFRHYYFDEIEELFCFSYDKDEIRIGALRKHPGYCCSEKEIQTEQEGIEVFVDVLSSTGLAFEIQDGTWSIYAAETALVPDVRFLVEGQYAYLEFNSVEDPGAGIATNFPVYREVHPGHYAQVRSQTSLWVDQALQIMNKDVKE